MTQSLDDFAAGVAGKLGGRVQTSTIAFGELTIVVEPSDIVATLSLLRDIGWYGGATFLPSGEGLPLTDAHYAHALSPANAARLEAILARAK